MKIIDEDNFKEACLRTVDFFHKDLDLKSKGDMRLILESLLEAMDTEEEYSNLKLFQKLNHDENRRENS